MKIIVINQPTKNRGDESAHRSLIRTMIKKLPSVSITVLFYGIDVNTIEQMKIANDNVKYLTIPTHRGCAKLFKLSILFKFDGLLAIFHPFIRKYISILKQGNLILNAPGGICMGLFQNWEHIYWLRRAKNLKKPLAYYSRSFGPFPINSRKSRVFKKKSVELLKYFCFLSVRDSETMKIAEELKLNFVPSIDTAFLDVPEVEIPDDIKKILGKNYMVFVPNSLTWQPQYKKVDQDLIDCIYLAIIDLLHSRFPENNIVMLPQLFNRQERGDFIYFGKLKNKSNCHNLIVLSDQYGSDIQQSIIAKSHLVIGARYHSIVFAINNNVPFVALSYEHKINGLLNILNKTDSLVDLSLIGNDKFDANVFMKLVKNAIQKATVNIENNKEAASIAAKCFDEFRMFINKYSS